MVTCLTRIAEGYSSPLNHPGVIPMFNNPWGCHWAAQATLIPSRPLEHRRAQIFPKTTENTNIWETRPRFTSWRGCIAQGWFAGLAPAHGVHGHHTELVIHIRGQGQQGRGVIPWHSAELLPPPRLPAVLFKLYNWFWAGKETKKQRKKDKKTT